MRIRTPNELTNGLTARAGEGRRCRHRTPFPPSPFGLPTQCRGCALCDVPRAHVPRDRRSRANGIRTRRLPLAFHGVHIYPCKGVALAADRTCNGYRRIYSSITSVEKFAA